MTKEVERPSEWQSIREKRGKSSKTNQRIIITEKEKRKRRERKRKKNKGKIRVWKK